MSNLALDNLIESMNERVDKVGFFVDSINDTINKNVLTQGKKKGACIDFPNNIIMLGCGGTGSWLAPKLIKVINDATNKGMILGDVKIIFADGDEIEEKNLIRQNFVGADVGKNKAEVIATRYGQHVTKGVQVGYQDCFVVDDTYKIPAEHADKFVKLSSLGDRRGKNLVINLIDNGKTRKMVHRHALNSNSKRSRSWHVIDVANNTYNGQLNYSLYGSNNPSLYVSQFYNQHPDHLGDNDDISLFSCADEDATAVEQLFNANDMAASVTCNFINHWIAEGKITYGQVKFTTGAAPQIDNSVRLFKWDNSGRLSFNQMWGNGDSLLSKTLEGMNDDTDVSKMEDSWKLFSKEAYDLNSGYKRDLDHAAA